MKSISTAKCVAFILILYQSILSTNSVSLEQDLTISSDQKEVLEKFRELVEEKLPHEYMKKDIYLIRWLRAKDFDIPAAKQMLLNALAWRAENRIDSILEEDFSDVHEDDVYYVETFETEQRTGLAAYWEIGAYDARKKMLQGKMQRILRYMDRYLESMSSRVRDLQTAGHNISQYDFVMNMAGFNIIQHGCVQCITTLTTYILSYENHYPGTCNKMFLINTPSAFEVLLNAMKIVTSRLTREALQIYGTSKAQWQPKVFSVIPQSVLPTTIGGSKIFE